MDFAKVYCKKGKEKVLQSRNSWLYTGAIAKRVDIAPGKITEVYDYDGNLSGYGFYYGGRNIEVYLFDFTSVPQNPATKEYWEVKISKAFELRKKYTLPKTSAYRLIHSEGDGMPGLTIDIYNDIAVVDFKIYGMESVAGYIFDALQALGYQKIKVNKSVSGKYENYTRGDVPAETVITEYGLKFAVDIATGQKTGFYIDQRENRNLLKKYSEGRTVLNMFSYTGGFSVYALAGGAKQVWSADISKQALEIADKNRQLNAFESERHIILNEDAFDTLSKLEPNMFDLIVLDPPAFAKKDKDVPNAVKAYRELNYEAIKKIKKGGIVFTFSCSQKIDKDLFRKIVFTAAAKAQRPVRILHQLTQPEDHPIDIFQPKSEYLKGFVLYVE